jgi:hypothetical protein
MLGDEFTNETQMTRAQYRRELFWSRGKVANDDEKPKDESEKKEIHNPMIRFGSQRYSVMENAGEVAVTVIKKSLKASFKVGI